LKKTIFVLGAGSAGTRHFENLNSLGAEARLLSRRKNSEELERRFNSMAGWKDADSIIVATESSQHEQALLAIAASGFKGRVLVEKPGIISKKNLQSMRELDIRVAYNLRYLDGLGYIKSEVGSHKSLTGSVVCRSDLTTWREDWNRPGQYSRSSLTSGGVLFDVSHEIDYVTNIFGVPTFVTGLGGRLGRVTLDSDDSWKIVAGYESGLVISIDLSYLSHLTERSFSVQLESKTISLDLLSGEGLDSSSGRLAFNKISTTYNLMIRDWLENGGSRLPNLEENLKTLGFISSIRALEAKREPI